MASILKTQLHKLIDEEQDVALLKAIKTLLSKNALNPELKEKLTQRALKAEDDIKNGKVYTLDQARKRAQ
jgi:hypothetical protein